jgi:hypothetical protein
MVTKKQLHDMILDFQTQLRLTGYELTPSEDNDTLREQMYEVDQRLYKMRMEVSNKSIKFREDK